jgi:hypothetical protein
VIRQLLSRYQRILMNVRLLVTLVLLVTVCLLAYHFLFRPPNYSCSEAGRHQLPRLGQTVNSIPGLHDVSVAYDCDDSGNAGYEFAVSRPLPREISTVLTEKCAHPNPPDYWAGGYGRRYLCEMGGLVFVLALNEDGETGNTQSGIAQLVRPG